MDDRGRDDHDCSFDIKMTKCICNCHSVAGLTFVIIV